MYEVDAEALGRLALAAALMGACLGFMFTGLINNLFEYLWRRRERLDRIEAARTRDHASVPAIK